MSMSPHTYVLHKTLTIRLRKTMSARQGKNQKKEKKSRFWIESFAFEFFWRKMKVI